MITDEDKYIANQYIVMIIENLIREMELQGRRENEAIKKPARPIRNIIR